MFPFRSFSEEVLCLVSLFATIPSREDAPSMQSGGACVCAPLFCHQELFVPPPIERSEPMQDPRNVSAVPMRSEDHSLLPRYTIRERSRELRQRRASCCAGGGS